MISDYLPDGGTQNYFGLYPAIVNNIVDPKELGRVEVRFPWLGSDGDRDVRAWATLISPYADKDQGLQVLPEKLSQVVVGFEAGDLRRPYIVGACWNGKEKMPQKPEKSNNKRLLKTRSGHLLEFDDQAGAQQVLLKTQGGHEIKLDDTPATQSITVKTKAGSSVEMKDVPVSEIVIKTPQGHEIKISDTFQITISVPVGRVTVECLQATINASAILSVNAPLAQFSGIVQANTIAGSTYVPAPGNTYGL